MILSNEVANYIANKITSNVRQLEGTVHKIKAFHDLGIFMRFSILVMPLRAVVWSRLKSLPVSSRFALPLLPLKKY